MRASRIEGIAAAIRQRGMAAQKRKGATVRDRWSYVDGNAGVKETSRRAKGIDSELMRLQVDGFQR